MKTMLLTGFGLWGEERYNTSWDILRDNPLALPNDWTSKTAQLPVSWSRVPGKLDALLEDPSIRAVVCFGMCSGRAIRLERLALNLNDAGLIDVDGEEPPGEFALPGAPPAYWTGFPFDTTLRALRSAGIPAEESRSCGGFLCNYTFYHLMHRIALRKVPTIGGFVHVPHYETEGGLPLEHLSLTVPVVAAEAAKIADSPELPLL